MQVRLRLSSELDPTSTEELRQVHEVAILIQAFAETTIAAAGLETDQRPSCLVEYVPVEAQSA